MQQMNGIAVRVDRIKGRCRCDITGTVNYWVLLEVGGHAARFAEPPRFTCMNLNILLPLYNVYLPIYDLLIHDIHSLIDAMYDL